MRARHETGGSAECDAFEYVGTAPDAAIDENRDAPVYRLDDARQRAETRRGTIELPSAVIGNDDPVNAVIERAFRFVRA